MKFQTISADGVTAAEVPDEHVLVAKVVTVMPSSHPDTGASIGIVVVLEGHTIRSGDPSRSVTIIDAATIGHLVLASVRAVQAAGPEATAAYLTALNGGL